MGKRRFLSSISGAPVGPAHWDWDSLERVTIPAGGGAARTLLPLTGKSYFVQPSIDARMRAGDVAVEADADSPPLSAAAVYWFPRAQGEIYVSFVAKDGASTGLVEVWEANDFEPAT